MICELTSYSKTSKFCGMDRFKYMYIFGLIKFMLWDPFIIIVVQQKYQENIILFSIACIALRLQKKTYLYILIIKLPRAYMFITTRFLTY